MLDVLDRVKGFHIDYRYFNNLENNFIIKTNLEFNLRDKEDGT